MFRYYLFLFFGLYKKNINTTWVNNTVYFFLKITAQIYIFIGQIPQLELKHVSSTGGTIKCNGGSTAVTINAVTGTPPYSGAGNFTQFAGKITYTVTDANGCSVTKNETKKQPPVLSDSIVTQSNVTCMGGSNGSVTVAGSGGTPNYLYKINIAGSTYQENGTFSGLAAKKYKKMPTHKTHFHFFCSHTKPPRKKNERVFSPTLYFFVQVCAKMSSQNFTFDDY